MNRWISKAIAFSVFLVPFFSAAHSLATTGIERQGAAASQNSNSEILTNWSVAESLQVDGPSTDAILAEPNPPVETILDPVSEDGNLGSDAAIVGVVTTITTSKDKVHEFAPGLQAAEARLSEVNIQLDLARIRAQCELDPEGFSVERRSEVGCSGLTGNGVAKQSIDALIARYEIERSDLLERIRALKVEQKGSNGSKFPWTFLMASLVVACSSAFAFRFGRKRERAISVVRQGTVEVGSTIPSPFERSIPRPTHFVDEEEVSIGGLALGGTILRDSGHVEVAPNLSTPDNFFSIEIRQGDKKSSQRLLSETSFIVGSSTDSEVRIPGNDLQVAVAFSDEKVALVSRLSNVEAYLGDTPLGLVAVPVTERSSFLRLPNASIDLSELVPSGTRWTLKSRWATDSDLNEIGTASTENCSAIAYGRVQDLQAKRAVDSFSSVGQRSAVWALEAALGTKGGDAIVCIVGVAEVLGVPTILFASNAEAIRISYEHELEGIQQVEVREERSGLLTASVPFDSRSGLSLTHQGREIAKCRIERVAALEPPGN